ncbi:unnamed protein product [Rotaria magnacalcarata]|uniref:Uncharacterized protein n=2 Tax=Rotaria magnacalcarata TaxID=392030 RepID=A0A816BZQ3_9BILA|nr:unnamed protein product [Rotaria magnacalcarata]CAF3908225.1 unnamed protein product [Rotaria magnacalcarata]
MDLSLFYFVFTIFILLPTADQAEFNLDSDPTSRRLLFFGRFNFSLGEKKSDHVSSLLKSSSSPSKHVRTNQKPGVTVVYVRPQTSNELGKQVRSFSHLLKPKLVKKQEQTKVTKIKLQQKKPKAKKAIKKKNATPNNTKTRELVAINDEERDRCRALLHIDQETIVTPIKKSKKIKVPKKLKPSKEHNVTTEAKKKVVTPTKPLPVKNDKQKSQKSKPEKINVKSISNEKKKPTNKPSETQPSTPPPPPPTINQAPKNAQTPPPKPSTPPLPPPPPPPISETSTKSKREKAPPIIAAPLDVNDEINIDHNEKNNSVVDRAYHFVRNMFQLSDDILENNYTHEDDQILSSINEEQHRQSRKLLSIDAEEEIILNDNDRHDWDFDELNEKPSFVSFNELPLSYVNVLKRQLLSVKKTKGSIPTEDSFVRSKRTNSAANKPKVGWAYRYRISRFLANQKSKRSVHGRKPIGGGNSHPPSAINKKISSSAHTKFSKRKLLGFESDDESDSNTNYISNEDIVNTVSITQDFVPKRQLFAAKKAVVHEEQTDDEHNIEKVNERRRKKSYEAITDPVEIVSSYERGLFKPRVGWQFRYRVSRYIDSLRQNIREDQERLKLGLEAIKRKTPQELSGRRKRVLDKPFASEEKEVEPPAEDNKPTVGWRYRYRISKMLEAKARGEYIDDEEEKRQARLDPKRKQSGLGKPIDDNDECVEWEYDNLDPELRKISEEGRRVGWAYRYRVRRKLDELKRQQAENGIAFDLETLTSELDKKRATTPTTTMAVPTETEAEVTKKSVGWQYRYRVSKMLEAQKREAAEAQLKGKKDDHIPLHERLDPELARLTPEERVVGWQYRYRIRRKLDAIKDATRESHAGKHRKHRRDKEKILKKVEESIETILNIDDIDETPFMEYFRRSSSYILFGLLPAGRKSICLLPLPVKFSFCYENAELTDTLASTTKTTSTTTTTTAAATTITTTVETDFTKPTASKKTRTKKEKRSEKQSVPSRSIQSDASVETIVKSVVKPVSKTPVKTIEKPQKKPVRQRLQSSTRYQNDEQVRHFDEEEQPIKKVIGVDSQRNKNKKQNQIIGKEVKVKQKNSQATPLPVTTTTSSSPIKTTTSSPAVEAPATKPTPKTTIAPPPPPAVETPLSTTTPAPLRSISEIIQEEATTFVTTKITYPEETTEEINEANENLQPTITTTTTTTSTPSAPSNDDTLSDEDDSESSLSDTDSDSDSDSESTSTEDSNDTDDNADLSPMKKMKQMYENAKESVHDVFDLHDEKDSP